MLWTKESNKKNALYVDLLASYGGETFVRNRLDALHREDDTIRYSFRKNDAISLQKRKDGNIKFGQGKWADAMEMYNECLLYAEDGSNNVSLAYANRSACFYKMKRYNECLIDIEMAKEAGYPADLMPKLDRRRGECLKVLEEGTSSAKFECKLSFDPDERFPCMANVLKIERHNDGEFAVIATEDIDVGQTVVVEKAFIMFLFLQYGLKCNICGKELTNLTPCKTCNSAMFCSKECENDPIHKYECVLRLFNRSQINGVPYQALRSCLLAIEMFSTAEEMMNFVEESLNSYPKLLASSSDAKSRYNLFLKLPLGIAEPKDEVNKITFCFAFVIYKTLLNFPHIKTMFSSKQSRRFLMHLILQHFRIIAYNVWVTSGPTGDSILSGRVGFVLHCFEHSCAPNVIRNYLNGNTIVKTIRPIKKGGKVLISNISLKEASKEVRQKELWEQRRLICKCSLCSGVSASAAERNQLKSDPDFHLILTEYIAVSTNDEAALRPWIEKCENLLRKYGKIGWCEEFSYVVQIYNSAMQLQRKGRLI